MSKHDDFETALLDLILNNIQSEPLSSCGSGLLKSVTEGSLYVSLHDTLLVDGDTQEQHEVSWAGATPYARVAVARDESDAKWTVASGAASNADPITFPECQTGSATASHFAVGVGSAGVTRVLWSGALTASLSISAGITASFAVGELDITED